jgi:hypothetical protein
MRTPDDIVRVEVHYCISSLVAVMAAAWGVDHVNEDMDAAHEQAQELFYGVEDWEEAAIQDGWEFRDGILWNAKENMMFGGDDVDGKPDWRGLCEEHDIEPYQREVFEHWIVSDWLADQLSERGEKVDKDFCGLTVWGRTTTGQGIASDSVIEAIAADLNKPFDGAA